MLNLLSNGIKFTPGGGIVSVAAARDGEEVSITVADNGIGMTTEEIPRALLPFEQVDDGSLSRCYEGTGLGLPLVKALTELHGGTINIDSAPGVGTTVTIRLPAMEADLQPKREVSAVPERAALV